MWGCSPRFAGRILTDVLPDTSSVLVWFSPAKKVNRRCSRQINSRCPNCSSRRSAVVISIGEIRMSVNISIGCRREIRCPNSHKSVKHLPLPFHSPLFRLFVSLLRPFVSLLQRSSLIYSNERTLTCKQCFIIPVAVVKHNRCVRKAKSLPSVRNNANSGILYVNLTHSCPYEPVRASF